MGLFQGDYRRACSVMSLIYLVGLALIWLAPGDARQTAAE